MNRMTVAMIGWLLCGNAAVNDGATEAGQDYFAIQIVDAETGRGVPLVCLTTVNRISRYTDSNGWIAFSEPGLEQKKVFFEISSHGYEYPEDGFGYRGVVLEVRRGGSATIKINRINLAERLYRVTGAGIYRDSLLLGKQCPIDEPLLNGDVVGQDTVQAVIYRDRIYWFWGDTNRPDYPLGQFRTSGAISRLPSDGGLKPGKGVNLKYFVDENGFSRKMAPVPGKGAVWLHGLTAIRSPAGQPLMFGHYTRLKELENPLEHGLLRFNDETQTFDKWVELEKEAMLFPRGVSLVDEKDTGNHIYFCNPFPALRVEKDERAITDPTRYEAFTCLKPGAKFDAERDVVERNAVGDVVWGWKRNTDSLDPKRLHSLIQAGFLKESEARLRLHDSENDEPVYVYAGSVHWNEFRQRWVMIAQQAGGKSSFIGEIWYAESRHLEGPWENVRHIVTHDHYSFYNPAQHPFFDEQGGRYIYFDGTFVTTFSKAKMPVPRYDYNQIMYRLDLGGPRMALPAGTEREKPDSE